MAIIVVIILCAGLVSLEKYEIKYSLSSLSKLLRVPNVCSLHSPIQISAKRNKRPSGGV